MLVININVNNLNTSLQVGDMIYVTSTGPNLFNSSNQSGGNIDANNRVGFLVDIDQTAPTTYILRVDDTGFTATVSQGDFLMFSKHNQSNDDIKGYYMKVKLLNDSKHKAELFSLGSEATESSK